MNKNKHSQNKTDCAYFACGYSIYFIVVWSAFLFYNSRMYETGSKFFEFKLYEIGGKLFKSSEQK